LWYRRVTEIFEVDPPPPETIPTPWKARAQFGMASFGQTASESSLIKKRKADEVSSSEESLIEFKRIRLISKKRRIKRSQAPSLPFQAQYPSAWSIPQQTEISVLQPTGFQTDGDSWFAETVPKPEREARPVNFGTLLSKRKGLSNAPSSDKILGLMPRAKMLTYRESIEAELEEEEDDEKEQQSRNIDDNGDEDMIFSLSSLGLKPGAPPTEIRDTFRSLISYYLIQLLDEDEGAIKRFMRVRLSYDFLILPLLRKTDIPILRTRATQKRTDRAKIPSTRDDSRLNSKDEKCVFYPCVLDAYCIGEIIYHLTLIHGSASDLDESLTLWLHIIELDRRMKEERVTFLARPIDLELHARIWELINRGDELMAELRELLGLCEDCMPPDAKTDNDDSTFHRELDYVTGSKIFQRLFETAEGCNTRRTLVEYSKKCLSSILSEQWPRPLDISGHASSLHYGVNMDRAPSPDIVVIHGDFL
jgi:hypothetical protein